MKAASERDRWQGCYVFVTGKICNKQREEMSCFIEASDLYWISLTKMRRCCFYKKALDAYFGVYYCLLPTF
jgi:hypothetical protein